jgi:hypothetical protein
VTVSEAEEQLHEAIADLEQRLAILQGIRDHVARERWPEYAQDYQHAPRTIGPLAQRMARYRSEL